jgi:hypothetical protein
MRAYGLASQSLPLSLLNRVGVRGVEAVVVLLTLTYSSAGPRDARVFWVVC